MDEPSLELVAINDLMEVDNLAYLLRFDTVYGRYGRSVAVEGGDLVVECTGALTRREDLEKHIRAGARFVLLSTPSKDESLETVIHGVNRPGDATTIFSCASCTTNCITPLVEIIGRRIGIEKALMTTVHAYTSSQAIVDGPGMLRRARKFLRCFLVLSGRAQRSTLQRRRLRSSAWRLARHKGASLHHANRCLSARNAGSGGDAQEPRAAHT